MSAESRQIKGGVLKGNLENVQHIKVKLEKVSKVSKVREFVKFCRNVNRKVLNINSSKDFRYQGCYSLNKKNFPE